MIYPKKSLLETHFVKKLNQLTISSAKSEDSIRIHTPLSSDNYQNIADFFISCINGNEESI